MSGICAGCLPGTKRTTTPRDGIGRCGCGRRARHRRFPSRLMAGSGVDRSWAGSSTSTRRRLETAGQAPCLGSGTRQAVRRRVRRRLPSGDHPPRCGDGAFANGSPGPVRVHRELGTSSCRVHLESASPSGLTESSTSSVFPVQEALSSIQAQDTPIGPSRVKAKLVVQGPPVCSSVAFTKVAPMQHVFLSFRHEDIDFAEGLTARLESHGLPTWADWRISVGDEWRAAIDSAIRNQGDAQSRSCWSAAA